MLPSPDAHIAQTFQNTDALELSQNSTFHDLTNLAKEIGEAPIALIRLLGGDRCWFMAPCDQLIADRFITTLDQEGSLYHQTIQQTAPLIVPDIQPGIQLDRLYGNPTNGLLQQDGTRMRFYAGFPLVDAQKVVLGALCIIDYQPRALTEKQQTCLSILSRQIVTQLQLKDRLLERAKTAQTVLATMSHEIRTPMNAVLGMANLLSETTLDNEQQEFVDTIRIGSNSLLALINDILDFSRLEAGKVKLEELEFDLNLCIEEVVDLMATMAYGKGLELAILIAENIPSRLRGDVNRLRQILINLVANAIKFTSYGEIIIKVELQAEDHLTAKMSFSVRDTGIGIPVSAHASIFQPFSQFDPSLIRTYGGSGLGLSICKDLVELMGGTISLESVEGVGTCFSFILTFGKAIDHGTPLETSYSLAQAELCVVGDRLKNTKILLVESKTTTYQVLQFYFGHLGVHIDRVGNSISALKTLQTASQTQEPYTLVMIDGQANDAKLFASQVNADPSLTNTASIIMTSFNQREIVKHYHQLGFTNYLVKPLKKNRLLGCFIASLNEKNWTVCATPRFSHNLPHQSSQRSYQPPIPPLPKAAFRSSHTHPSLMAAIPEVAPQKLKILLVEDTPLNQKVILKLLNRLGYQADLAKNGKLALESMNNTDYDLVLMDCQMPIMDGYTATQAIRDREGQKRHTVVVAMTANAMVGDREKCLAVGMDDYLSKPVFKETLAEKLLYWHQKILSDSHYFPSHTVVPEAQGFTSIENGEHMLIDWQHLDQVSEGDRSFAIELVQLFLQGNQPNLALAQTAIDTTDFTRLKQIAHQIKGSAINIGSTRIHNIAETIEQKAKSQQLDGVELLLNELIDLFQQVQSLWQQQVTK